jgi:ferritin-like metal-binding protein YciE
MALESVHDLYVEHVRDLYSAEQQITEALPKMIAMATDPQLREGLTRHLEETRRQAGRLVTIAKGLDIEPEGKTCQGMKGLLDEGAEVLTEDADPAVRDTAIVSAGQRVEHYEISAYGSARTYARLLGRHADIEMLHTSISEEGGADKTLTMVGEQIIRSQVGPAA